jgi:hypothetical protein
VDGLLARCQAPLPAVAPPQPHGLAIVPHAAQDGAPGAAAAVWQLSALGVAAAWRLGAWQLLRGYLAVIENARGGGDAEPGSPTAAAGPTAEAFPLPNGGGGAGGPAAVGAALGAGDTWEVLVGALLDSMQRGDDAKVRGPRSRRSPVVAVGARRGALGAGGLCGGRGRPWRAQRPVRHKSKVG